MKTKPETTDARPRAGQLREELDGIRRRIASLQAEIDRETSGVRTSAAGADIGRALALQENYIGRARELEGMIRDLEEGFA